MAASKERMAGLQDPPASRTIVRAPSLAATAADQIRELIITDQLHLGDALSEAGLAAQFGISRTPVRDALQRLLAERLVVIRPQHGTFVFQYDLAQLRYILGLREVLELGALRIALEVDRQATLIALEAAAAAGVPLLPQGPKAYQTADAAFHASLVKASCNPELIDAYDRISGRIRAIRFRNTTTMTQINHSQRDHELIFDAIRAGDDAQAMAVLARHLYNSYDAFLAKYDFVKEI